MTHVIRRHRLRQVRGGCAAPIRPTVLLDQNARIERDKSKASVAELLAIADRAAMRLKRSYVDHAEVFYGDTGLPK